MAEPAKPLPAWKEHESIEITNPTKQDFTVNFNGEPYTLSAGDTNKYSRFLAFHLAKHLSTRMLEPEATKLKEEFKESVYVPQVGTLMNHDNPSRRIALYDILGSKNEVENFFIAIPLKSFIGDMSKYDAYVAKKEAKSETTPVSAKDTKKTE
jgi:hypothetical protein